MATRSDKEWSQNAGPFKEPFERHKHREPLLGVMSWAHNYDLILITILLLALLLAIAGVFVIPPIVENTDGTAAKGSAGSGEDAGYITLLATIVTVIFGVVGQFIYLAHSRMGMIDTITSDILSIGRVFIASDIIGYFMNLHKYLADAEADAKADAERKFKFGHYHVTFKGKTPIPHGFAAAAREENYFSVFDANIGNLGSLRASIVTNVTAFYTFLKAARDATRSIKDWERENYNFSMKRLDIINVIYLCLLSAIHGRKALEELCMDRYIRGYCKNTFYLIEVKAFKFLENNLSSGDYRKHYIDQRRSDYDEIIEEIKNSLGDDFWSSFSAGLMGGPPNERFTR
jgi:hypothetical protein